MDHKGKPRFVAHLLVIRRHAYYTNILVVNFFLCSLAFSSYAVPLTDFADRASVNLTLILTVVAYKIIVADMLPKVPYGTIADIFMNAGFAVLFALVIQNAVVVSMKDADSADKFDKFTYFVLAAVWGGFHIFLTLGCYRFYRRIQAALGQPFSEFLFSHGCGDEGVKGSVVAAQAIKLL